MPKQTLHLQLEIANDLDLHEVAQYLRIVAQRLEAGHTTHPIFNTRGQQIGHYSLSQKEPHHDGRQQRLHRE